MIFGLFSKKKKKQQKKPPTPLSGGSLGKEWAQWHCHPVWGTAATGMVFEKPLEEGEL